MEMMMAYLWDFTKQWRVSKWQDRERIILASVFRMHVTGTMLQLPKTKKERPTIIRWDEMLFYLFSVLNWFLPTPRFLQVIMLLQKSQMPCGCEGSQKNQRLFPGYDFECWAGHCSFWKWDNPEIRSNRSNGTSDKFCARLSPLLYRVYWQ